MKVDTDGDGYNDYEDAYPLIEPFIKKSYIFYQDNGDDFLVDESEHRYEKISKNQLVEKYEANDFATFKTKWNSMGYNQDGKGEYIIDNVYTVYHGGPDSINIGKDRMYKTYLSTLASKEINTVHLSSCNNGNLDFFDSRLIDNKQFYQNIAISLLKIMPEIKNVYAWDGYAVYYKGLEYSQTYPNFDNWIHKNSDFEKWSIFVNQAKRENNGLIHYYKDNLNNIVCDEKNKILFSECGGVTWKVPITEKIN